MLRLSIKFSSNGVGCCFDLPLPHCLDICQYMGKVQEEAKHRTSTSPLLYIKSSYQVRLNARKATTEIPTHARVTDAN